LSPRAVVRAAAEAAGAQWKHHSANADEVVDALRFTKDGLIPAIAQQFDTHEVLMMAWMNEDAVRETLATGRVCYYSRSRQKLWRKGESSGQVQSLVDLTFDCDADSILMQVDQLGVACHTGRLTCFYKSVRSDGIIDSHDVLIDPNQLYKK